MIERCKLNPLIKPEEIYPSNPEFIVSCAFNPAVTKYKNQTILLLRIAETINNDNNKYIKIPVFDTKSNKFIVKSFKKDEVELLDTRGIKTREGIYLSTISHLRIARSDDGIHFKIDKNPTIVPESIYESYGIEDPRITKIQDDDFLYLITYTSVSPSGITVSLIETKDFNSFKRKGIILPPDNKDVMIFPEKINGKYYMLHRPMASSFRPPSIWIAESYDLINWGNHKFLIGPRKDSWDSKRIGGGDVPIKIDQGWLEIYHGVDNEGKYHLGALLLDKDDPSKVIARSKTPILSPEKKYEKSGFYNNVVFTCGSLFENNSIYIYYGASDKYTCLAQAKLDDIFNTF